MRTVALIERCTVAEVRRRAVTAYVSRALDDPAVAEIVTLILASRRRAAGDRTNVLELRRRAR